MKFRYIVFLVFVLLLATSQIASTQGFPCVITGTVTYDGSPVSGAQVSVSSGGSTTSGDGGNYLLDVPSGSSITVTATYNGHSGSSSASTPSDGGAVTLNVAISSSSSGGSGGDGNGGSYNPISTPVPTPTPTPTPTPPNRLYITLPTSTIVDNVSVGISGTNVTVPYGYLFVDVIKAGKLDVPIAIGDNASGVLKLIIEPTDSQSGTIKSMNLVANKIVESNGQEIGINIDLSLADLPPGSSLSIDILDPNSVDISQINAQLAFISEKRFNTTPLLVFEATKNGLQNGKDIMSVRLTFTIPRPISFDDNTTYYAIRENDGMYELLNATLVNSSDENLLTFEITSPYGLSVFSVVKTELVKPTLVPATPTPTPTLMPTNNDIGNSIYMILIGILVGAIGGIGAILILLKMSGK